jgi:hypothetical protein
VGARGGGDYEGAAVITIEQELRTVIEAETARVGEAGPDFFAAVAARTRQRRRRRQGGVVGAIAVGLAAVVVVTAVAVPALRETKPAPQPVTQLAPVVGPDKLPDFDKLPDVAKVWPNAVTALPRKLPNGSYYVVQAVLPEGRYLVLEWKTSGPGFNLQQPSVFDPAAGIVRRLTDPSAAVDFTRAGVSGSNAVWATSVYANDTVEIWTAPLAGGAARKVFTLPRFSRDKVWVDGFTLVGDSVMWHAGRDVERGGRRELEPLGIFKLPLAGGQPQSVPDTVGFEFMADYSGFGGVVALAQRRTATGGELLDLATGRRSTWTRGAAVPEGIEYIRCSLVGCVGEASISQFGVVVQRPDGSGVLAFEYGRLTPIGDGRFVAYNRYRDQQASLIVWDRATGRAAVGYRQGAADALPEPGEPYHLGRPLITWQTDDALMLLDLTKIT